MARIKRGVTTRAKHKRILDQAKGYYGRRKNTIRIARQAVEKAGQYAYRDRKVKKRSFRALWIQRINAAVRAEGLTYGQFIHALKLAGITSTARSSPTSRCTRARRSGASSPRPGGHCPPRPEPRAPDFRKGAQERSCAPFSFRARHGTLPRDPR
jgi:large subunit ribosomal protein L20